MDTFALEWLGDRVRILDQTRLPTAEIYLELSNYRDVASAIMALQVRGAPAIGIAAAYALALGATSIKATSKSNFLKELQEISHFLAATRPTARNLFQSLERMQRVAETGDSVAAIKQDLIVEAAKIHAEEIEADMMISQLGAELLEDGFTVLTHCNTGTLATGGYGTALGVIKQAWEQGKRIRVMATETRPLLQGARLTTWELLRAGIPVTLITDSMAGYFIGRGEVNCVIVGADRIAANGDTANKIGTYTMAVLAKEHGIPFYVAAPTTTIDNSLDRGLDIPIEERDQNEVTSIQGVAITPQGVAAANPAFDITPQQYITAIITERGIVNKPDRQRLSGIFS